MGLPILGITGLLGAAAIPGLADSKPERIDLGSLDVPPPIELAALPSTEKLWIKVRSDVTVEELSQQLDVNETRLAKLNEVDEDHSFKPGDWLVVPSQQSRKAKLLASLDTSELRRNPPIQSPPPVEESASVRFGDNLLKIAQRYGLTPQEILRFNPGLEAARLVVGTQLRLAQSAPGRSRMVLGLNPVGSGGLSWPELPRFGQPQQTDPSFSSNGWIWPAQGVFSSGYGWRWGRMHKGIDVANNVGTPILAAKSGRVVVAGWSNGGYGYLVDIVHDDGSLSRYAHNSRLLVSVGDVVPQGAVISLMGSTGNSTGPHLHFEIHPPGQGAINPLQFLPSKA
ncbi:M23 family metallopeptidase [Cyanobium sp. Morenito 9A2]|uniref:M23 family metallopeptidase n=1 Tax=Cyanobium sp. Morenito 9A2 TaxID=2823718 RepID=UPI0020CF4631|nr:M23 family metallopeptidase [Cyanobium sp. Morenito 9A2]